MAYCINSKAKKAREILTEYLKDIPAGGCVSSSDIIHHLKVNGIDLNGDLSRIVRGLGFKTDRSGGTSRYYRDYVPLNYKVEADENGHIPSLKERLEAQVAAGEREAPNMYYNSTEETKPMPVSVNEVRNDLGFPACSAGNEIGWNPDIETVHINFQPPKPKYQFQEVLVSKKLKGKYGEYTVLSDGQVIAELLVSGTMVNECFAELTDELNAVREEMEAICNG